MNDHLFGKELFIRFTVRIFRESLSICACNSFPFGFEGRMWDFIVLIPERRLSIFFSRHARTVYRINSCLPNRRSFTYPNMNDSSVYFSCKFIYLTCFPFELIIWQTEHDV